MNSHDQDLGSTAPALLSNGTALQVGKNQLADLVIQSSLGGNTGMGIATAAVCPGRSPAVATRSSERRLRAVREWTAGVADERVACLRLGALDQRQRPRPPHHGRRTGLVDRWEPLFGINPSTGATVEQLNVGGQANHFPTPSVGDGLLLAPASDQVVAFAGSAGIPGPPSPPPAPAGLVVLVGGLRRRHLHFRRWAFLVSTGSIRLNRPVVGMATTPPRAILAGGVGRGHLQFGAPLLRLDGRYPAQSADRGDGSDADGKGYWLVASDGGIFSFGDAAFYGSMGGRGSQPSWGWRRPTTGRVLAGGVGRRHLQLR